MKNISLILVLTFVFLGCSPKTVKVVVPVNPQIIITEPVIIKSEPIVIETEPEPEVEIVKVDEEDFNKIAVIYPSRIVGKYAKSTMSTISAFLIYNKKEFEIETFDTYDEKPESIINKINILNEKGYKNIIALFTKNGFNTLNSVEEAKNSKYYFPLINKNEIVTENENFIFGGISYKEQINLLRTLSTGKNSMFYVKSYLGNKLKNNYINSFEDTGVIKEIKRKNNKYKYIMNDKNLIESTVLLNTPIIKSSIILSQLTAYEINPKKVLSTQLNFNPLLLKLTQNRDRKNFYVVNSIAEVNSFIEDYTKLLGADIRYNWVDYSSLVGINYLLNENESFLIETQIIDNQVNYEPTLYKSTSYGFKKVLSH